MFKYILFSILSFLFLAYTITFNLFAHFFPFIEVFGSVLLAISAIAFMYRKNKIACILVFVSLMTYGLDLVSYWNILFQGLVPKQSLSSDILFLVIFTVILLTILILAIKIILSSNKEVMEIKRLNNYSLKPTPKLLLAVIPLVVVLIASWKFYIVLQH